jgi:SAM-dependent methyltransferase
VVATFEQLVEQALSAPFSGWDFSWLARRSAAGQSATARLPWSYQRALARLAATADTMLDMGTGGGERLARLRSRPHRTVATEAWPTNVPVAATRLGRLGIPVIQDEGAHDNTDDDDPGHGRLPFRDDAFALVSNRHEAFSAAEVRRVLAPGGTFITQQVDFHSHDAFYQLLGLEPPAQPDSWLPAARQQVERAGLTVLGGATGEERHEFADISAVVFYLRVVPWIVPGYSVDGYATRLRAAHETAEMWPLQVRMRRFLLVATKR